MTDKCYELKHVEVCSTCRYTNAYPCKPENCPRCKETTDRAYKEERKARLAEEKAQQEQKDNEFFNRSGKERKARTKAKYVQSTANAGGVGKGEVRPEQKSEQKPEQTLRRH